MNINLNRCGSNKEKKLNINPICGNSREKEKKMNVVTKTNSAAVLVALGLTLTAWAAEPLPYGHKDFYPSPQRPVGWRGDGTGTFPGAKPPTQWNGPGPRDVAPGQGKGAKVEVPLVWPGSQMKNVLWQVPMPHQSCASPIVVKGKVITLADPHTILAYDADTGKRLWHNAQDTFDLLCKDPAEAKKLRRLYDLYHRHFSRNVQGRWTTKDGDSGMDLVAEAALAERELKAADIDPSATSKVMNHMTQHPFFAKYGLCAFVSLGLASTMSTPVSDGTWVWVLWSSTRTVACYDVDTGKCRWMRQLGARTAKVPGFCFNSPLLVDGILVVTHEDLISGLDPATGKDVWQYPRAAGGYACETPAVTVFNGQKALLLWNTTLISTKTGKQLAAGAIWPGKAKKMEWGTSPVLCGPNRVVQVVGQYGEFCGRDFGPDGIKELFGWVQPLRVNEDTGNSVYYDGFVYVNDSDTSALLDPATGRLTDRGISGPNGGYPGCNIAGQYFFNFDGAASCTVTTLGPQGKLVSINHLVPGYAHTKRLTNAQGHDMKGVRGFTRDWWKQVFAARDEGVIGWVGRTDTLAAGEMTAGPFFQGDRIYLRTHTDLICIGVK